jgi:hypothetical protein
MIRKPPRNPDVMIDDKALGVLASMFDDILADVVEYERKK